ncbi:MAG: ABC transporter permease [Gammaproteobacteria bacterium]
MLLARASLRFLARHPAQCLLAVSGIALGTAIVIGILVTQASARQAFAESLRGVFGDASHRIVALDGEDFDERVLAEVRRLAPSLAPTPVVSGAVRLAPDAGRGALGLLGVDPFTAQGGSAHGALPALTFITQPGAMLLAAASAETLGLVSGASLALADSTLPPLTLAGVVAAGADGAPLLAPDVALVDIATAQETLGRVGRLTRIELTSDDSDAARAALARLAAALPAGLRLVDAGREAASARSLTRAFYTNLDALSLLALLVGAFMIYNTMAFLVAQRQALLTRLRALGVTRAELARLVLGEALVLGALGGALGCALGQGLARLLMAPVGQTLRDHYQAAGAGDLAYTPALAAGGVLLAALTALLAALPATLDALRVDPARAARYSLLATRAEQTLARTARLGVGCAALAALVLLLSSRSLHAGFVALGATILAAMLIAPWLVRATLRRLARPGTTRLPLAARLALRGAARDVGRIGLAVAALMAATATAVGVGLMVDSFRDAVDAWLGDLLRAEVYISPGFDEQAPPALDEDFIAKVAALPMVETVSRIRRVHLRDDAGELRISAYQLPPAARRGFHFLAGAAPWPAWEGEDVAMISEPFAWHTRKQVGDALTLPTPVGPRSFRISGIYTDYGSERGVVAISLARFRAYWQDPRLHGIGVYPRPGQGGTTLRSALQPLLAARPALVAWSNAELRAHSLAVFDRTFAVTQVLTLLSALIAALGVFNALLALHLERAREYAVLLATGLAPGALRAVLYLQTALVALFAALLALPLGVLIARLLIAVINIRSFGWSMALTLDAHALLLPALGAFGAALAATVYPAERAARIDPASALRYE